MLLGFLSLVKCLLGAGAILMAITGFGFLLAGLYQAPYFASCRVLVTNAVLPVMNCSWSVMPIRANALAVAGYQAYVRYWFRQSENNFLVSGVFAVVVLLGIPAGALFNAMRGGSPFLLIFLASLVLVFITLTILTETNRLRSLAGPLSMFLFLALFIFVPGYVFHSLTDRLLSLSVGRAVIGSFLVVPLLYLAAQSCVLAIFQFFPGRSAEGMEQIKLRLISIIAGLPLAYLLTFATFLADQFSEVQTLVSMTWETLVMGVGVLSISISITLSRVSWGKRQHALLMRGSVTILIVAVFGAIVADVMTTEGYGTIAAQSTYWKQISQPHFSLILWLLLLAMLPVLVILLFHGILVLARTMSYVFPNRGGAANRGRSRACVLIGSSTLSVGVFISLLSALI